MQRRLSHPAILTSVAILAALTLITLAGCGGGHRRARPARMAAPSYPAPPSPPLAPAAPAPVKGPSGGLAIGLTELDPDLLAAAPRAVPASFSHARALLAALAPEYLRLDIDWAAVQPAAGSPPALERIENGCDRAIGPCGPYRGIDATLRAIATERSRAGVAPQVVVVFFNAPRWATDRPSGCDGAGTPAGARRLTGAGLRAYRGLVLALLAAARRERVRLGWWSAWDEPNHPLFLSPQRARCSTSARSLAVRAYARLVRTLAGALRSAGADAQIVLGDLADFSARHSDATGIPEFVRELPAGVLCLSHVWALHLYPRGARGVGGIATIASADAPGGNLGDLAVLEHALDARGPCGRRARIWVTETGVGDPHAGGVRATDAQSLLGSCQLMDQALEEWYRDPRVDVAFQYTFREDTDFPVGLLSADLARVYPTYGLLRAWSERPLPSDPPPAAPQACH